MAIWVQNSRKVDQLFTLVVEWLAAWELPLAATAQHHKSIILHTGKDQNSKSDFY